MDDLKEEFGQNMQQPEQTVLYSVLGIVWCLQALVHLIITTSCETGTLYSFIPNTKHYCIPGSVLGTEWYSSEHYEVTASMDNKNKQKKKKNQAVINALKETKVRV